MTQHIACEQEPMEEFAYCHVADTEPIPGYRLIAPLGRGGFGEVWKCEAPGGLLKAVKFVQGSLHALDHSAPAEDELRAIQRIKAIRHPFILSMERVEVVEGELVIVLELADRNLADALRAEQAAGKPGIARESLVAYLREAAEALDLMNARHGLQHLDIKPQNLFLVANHVKVGDFGLVNSFSTDGQAKSPALGAITPLYAAPEVFEGSISAHCDQYSLAIVFQELLTGTLPFNGKNSRQLLMQHLQGKPDLQALPAGDREVVARALAKSPGDRFPSCSDFVQALLAGLTEVVSKTVTLKSVNGKAAPAEGKDADKSSREETRQTLAVKTVKTPAVRLCRPALPAGDGALRVEVLDLVNRTPHSEVWNARCEPSPGAPPEPRLVKVLFGCAGPGDAGVARLQDLRHPDLAAVDVVHHAPGRLVLCTAVGDRTLRDLLLECQAQGAPGVDRDALIALLSWAAGALDDMAGQEAYHLGINPRTLVLAGNRLRLADFGVAQFVWLPAGQNLARLNPRYSAPELHLRQRPGPGCDQYSLALVYAEMLTGACPNLLQGGKGGIDPAALERLPGPDRPVVARALEPDPRRRFDTAADFLAALEDAGALAPAAAPAAAAPAPRRASAALAPAAPSVDVLQTQFGTNLTANVIRQRLEGFRQQWQGEVVSADDRQLVFRMPTPRNFWQRWTGKQPGVQVSLRIGTPEVAAPEGVQTRTEVRMDLEPQNCTREQNAELLRVVGPLLVESVRTHLRLNPRGRMQERTAWHHPFELCSVLADGSLGPPVECQGKDISLNGIGFYLPGQVVPSSHVRLRLPKTEQTPRMLVPARIVRVQGCGDGWYEVGAVLLPPDELPEEAE
jgi:serine/threonine protein kinase